MTLDPAGLEAAAKVLAFRDLAADPDWHGVYEEEWAAQPEEYREAWRESVREVLAPYLAAVVPVTPTTENPPENVYARLRNRPPEPSAAVAWDEGYVAGFAAGRAAATPDAECPERFPLTGGTLEAVLTVGDIREVVPAPAATPDPPSDRNIARMFHEVYERLAPTFGYRTREESAVPWEKVPAKNRDLMTATVGAVRAHLAAASPDERLREALREIAESDAVDNALDPHRNVRIAQSALAAVDREAPPVPDPETNT